MSEVPAAVTPVTSDAVASANTTRLFASAVTGADVADVTLASELPVVAVAAIVPSDPSISNTATAMPPDGLRVTVTVSAVADEATARYTLTVLPTDATVAVPSSVHVSPFALLTARPGVVDPAEHAAQVFGQPLHQQRAAVLQQLAEAGRDAATGGV